MAIWTCIRKKWVRIMQIRKIAGELSRTLANLTLPDRPCSEPWQALERVWRDAGGVSYAPRGAQWLHPEKMVDVSVIIPCYNNAAYLRESINSVLSQQSRYSFEAVIVNDGSQDDTPIILAEYEHLPNVTVLHQENRGHSGARNAGLTVCRGRYLLFHDSDDTLLPGAIETLTACAERHDADVVAGGYLCKTPGGTPEPGLSYPAGEITDRQTVPGMTCGKLFRRELFADVQFPEGYWYEDSIISQILLPMARRVWAVDSAVFVYLLNQSGVSYTSQGRPKAIDSLYVTRLLLGEKQCYGLKPDAESYRHFLHMVLLTYHRTRRLEGDVLRGVFHCQCQLRRQYFPALSAPEEYSALEQALEKENFRQYLWQCETMWLRRRG